MAEIQIGKHICIMRPLSVADFPFDTDEKGKDIYINAKGEKLKKIQLQKAEYKWLNEATGQEETGDEFKSYQGKPIKAPKKTKVVVAYDTIDTSDIQHFVENEKTYQIISPSLKAELKEQPNKAIAFKYINSGFKIHRAVVTYYKEKDTLLMRCFRGDIRKLDMTEITETEEIKVEDTVEQLDISSIEV